MDFISTKSNVDVETVFQSFVPLLINLLGLFVSGNIYSDVVQDPTLERYPMILLFTCVLGFKGSIEMVYSIYIAKYRETEPSTAEYFSKVFYNTNKLVLNSTIIGLVIGIIGTLYISRSEEQEDSVVLNVLVTTTFSCMVTSYLFVFFLLIILEIIELCRIDVENVVMPLLSAISDLLELVVLRALFLKFHAADEDTLFLLGIVTLGIFTVNACVSLTSHEIDTFMSLGTLLFSTASSVVCGLVVERFADRFPFIAATFPFFSGMSIAITMIFIHRNFTSDYTTVSKGTIESTLVFISLVISIFFLWLSHGTLITFSSTFSLLFIGGFMLLTFALIQFLNKFTKHLSSAVPNLEIYTVPVTTVIADLLSMGVLFCLGILNVKCSVVTNDKFEWFN